MKVKIKQKSKVNKKDKNKVKKINDKKTKAKNKKLEKKELKDKQINNNKINKEEKTFNIFQVLILCLIVLVLSSIISGMLVFNNYEKLINTISSDKYFKQLYTTYNTITKNYVDKIDKGELTEAAINAMFEYLGDPNSMYLDESETKTLNSRLNGKYSGIGIEVINKDNKIVVNRVFVNTPAKKAGLKKDDVIVKVNKKDVSSYTTKELTDYIKKLKGTFSVQVNRKNKIIKFKLKKELVDEPVVCSEVINKVGYIYLSDFSKTSYVQFEEELKNLEKEKIQSLIIDLRQNTGGYLDAAYNISDLFLKKGDIAYQIKNNNNIKKIKAKTDEKRNYRIVVLVDGASASASEVLTLALKENLEDVRIVGEVTYGKGTVQKTKTLESGALFKYTTSYWLSPNGNSINEVGIVPDVILKYECKDNVDNQKQKAIEILE